MRVSQSGTIWTGMLLILLLHGCSRSPAIKLYRLEPIVESVSKAADLDATVVVAPVELPEYLNRKEIVTQNEPYRVSAAEFDRWAEPIESNIRSVLVENLSGMLPKAHVIDYRWDDKGGADYSVRVRVIKWSLGPDGDVRMNLESMIHMDGTPVSLRKSAYRIPREGDDTIATVAAMSAVIGQLSRDLADQIAVLATNED